ncbi:MAG: hypothetical protein BWZ04_00463 [Firmicutes bacterium ADurb.BinA205]|nr:MAG: hypothetical protein BWZ04_00463 [Firmicutes bacterium ADurb.BinA205]
MPDLMDDISMPSVPSASPSAPTSQKENQSAENKTAEFTDAATGFGKVYGKDDYKGAPIRFERVLSPDGFGKTFDSGKGEVRIPQGYVPAPDGFGAMYDSDAGKGQKAPGAAPAAVEKAADSDAALKEMFSIKPEQASQKPAESSMAAIDLTKPAENKAVDLAKAPQTAEQPKEEKAAAEKAEQPKPVENKAVELAKAPQTAEQPKEEKAAAEKTEQPKPVENKAVELAKAPQTTEQPKEEKAAENDAAEANSKRPHKKGKTVKVKARAVHVKAVEAKAEKAIDVAAESKAVELAKPAENKAAEQSKADESKPVELAKKPEQPKEMAAIEPPRAENDAAKPAENKAAEQSKADESKPVELAKKPEQPKEMAAIEPSKAEKEAEKPAENTAAEQPKADEKKPVELAKKPEQPKEMAAIEPSKAEKEAAKPAENKAAEQPKADESKPVQLAKDEKKAEAKVPEIPKAQGSVPQPANTNGVNQPGAIRPPVNAVPPQSPVKPAPMNNIPVQPGFGNIPPQNAGNNINGSGMQNAHGGAAFIGSIDDINKYVGNTDAQDHASPVESAETAAPAFTPINRVDSESSGLMDILRDVLAAIVGTLPGFVLWLIFGKLTLGLSAVNLLLNIIMFVCPLVMAAGSLFCYHYVNRDRFIDTKRCALICLAVLAFMIYMANRTVTSLQIVDICNNLKDYMTQITGFIGLSKEDIDAVWDDDMAKEITKEMTGFTKINFGRCFLNFSDILEKMNMNGDFAWSMLKSYLWGFTGGSIGIKLAKKYNLL